MHIMTENSLESKPAMPGFASLMSWFMNFVSTIFITSTVKLLTYDPPSDDSLTDSELYCGFAVCLLGLVLYIVFISL
jgi:hypothetical protein